jgi:hypothetical protein
MIVLTEDLNTISEGIPLGYIDLNGSLQSSAPVVPC